jgi:RsiW-degrading membrane proteinase PrsW (M82 family)
MDNYKLVISFIPVMLYYLVYYRYFSSGKSGIKFLSAFLSGTGFALFLLLISEIVSALIFKSNPIVKAFLTAGLIEKGGAFIILYVLFRDFKGFSVKEGIITGMFFALGFACVENIFYVYDQPGVVLYVRVVFSVPLHITTCGMVGFYLAISFLCSSRLNRVQYILKAILVPLFFHGIFDFLLIKGGPGVYFAAPVLIVSAVVLEVMLARSGSIYSQKELQVMGLDFESWRLKDRQPRYDRWVKRYTDERISPVAASTMLNENLS